MDTYRDSKRNVEPRSAHLITALMDAGNWISIAALALSAVTFVWTKGIESRLRRRGDKRIVFDAWVVRPVMENQNQLTQSIKALSEALVSADADAREECLSAIQNRQFNEWFFELEAICETQSDQVLADIQDYAQDLLDDVFEIINEAAEPGLSGGEIQMLVRRLVRSRQRFLASSRAAIEAERIRVGAQ